MKHPADIEAHSESSVDYGEDSEAFVVASYDEDRTIFWAPGLEVKNVRTDEERRKDAPLEFMEKPSSSLSIFNTVLVLVCLASIAYLLMELDILPKIF